jgi:CHAT domain-containing protein
VAPRSGSVISEKVLDELGALPDEPSRSSYVAGHAVLRRADAVQELIDASRAKFRAEPRAALALADAAVAAAKNLTDREVLARSFRAKGNALYNVGDNVAALEHHAKALSIFQQAGNAEEEARTHNAEIQPRILVGQYEEALAAADAAKRIFQRIGDQKRLGHVEINLGNIYHRQDRFEEGLACYERAYEMLLPHRDTEGLAVALYNMSVCLITLNNFPRALATYQRAREVFVANGMTLLVTQSDYNIAYLYYLRGEYGRAIEMLRAARAASEKNGDQHILALCYLDLAEIYLELNLSAEARDSAQEGARHFQKLGMGYEEAKCTAYEAMAHSQLGKAVHSLELFAAARGKFVREKNLVWPWLLDLYQAIVLYNEGRLFEGRRLCNGAADFFETSFLPTKAVLSRLLLARFALSMREFDAARRECSHALERLAALPTPVLHYQAHFLMGEVEQASGNHDAAYRCYQEARTQLETLRGTLRGDELKIAFMKNRLEVYGNLVELCLARSGQGAAEEALGYIEAAKSRSLAELLMHEGAIFALSDEGQSGLVRRIREMREELNWYYRRLEVEQLREDNPSRGRIEDLQKEALRREDELVRVLRELRSPEAGEARGSDASAVHADGSISLESIRQSLPPQAALLEYFSVKDQFLATVVTRDRIELLPLTPVSRVVNGIRMLRFQLSKFALGAEYVSRFGAAFLEAARSHLHDLYQELIAPLRSCVAAKHLVIVPHGMLHYLPFHALFDGDAYLIDSFSISYAPSASIYGLCHHKKSNASAPPLVIGVPDSRARYIENEVRAVASALPESKLVIGAEAGDAALRNVGLNSRWIHIATHGSFRQDNPMFSGIRLGPSYLNLYDLYQLKLDAELVTLSGCATGLNVVAAGDELLGLVRGLLYAGAHSLLLTLWDVHDRSTSDFMASFYRLLARGEGRAGAMRTAVRELRSNYPHPYYWAPFVLIGKAFSD